MLLWKRCDLQRKQMNLFLNEIEIVRDQIWTIEIALERMANDLMRLCAYLWTFFA